MKPLEEIRSFFEGDRFATLQGIGIDSVDGDRAVCSVRLGEQHHNALGVAQGGLIFTLADFAFAVAANHEVCGSVSLNSTIHFLRPARCEHLIATAFCEHRSKTICIYRIDVTDEHGDAIAQVSMTGYTRTPKPSEQP